MYITSIIDILIAVSVIPVIIIIFIKRTNKNYYMIYALLALLASIWSFSLGLFKSCTTYKCTVTWDRLIYITGIIIPPLFYYFSKLFPKEINISFLEKLILILPTLFLSISIFTTDLFIKEVYVSEEGNYVDLGILYLIWVLWFILFMLFGFYNIYRNFLGSKGLIREQIKYVLLATLPAFFFSVPFNIIFPIFDNYEYIWIGPLGVILMLGILFYVIVKYRYYNTRYYVCNFLYFIVHVVINTIILFIISYIFKREKLDFTELLIYFILSIFYVFLFMGLNKILKDKFEEKFLFYEYNPSNSIEKVQNVISSENDIDIILNKIISELKKNFNTKVVSILYCINDRFTFNSSCSYNSKNLLKQILLLVKEIKGSDLKDKTIVYEEVRQKLSKNINCKINRLVKLIERGEINIIIPIIKDDIFIGLVFLGFKKSSEVYSIQDIKFLNNVADKLSIVAQRFFINYKDVYLTLKYYSSPNKLQNSKLLELNKVKKLSIEKGTSRVNILKKLIKSSIEYFKPNDNGKKRTTARLKYEILKMIAYEGATESQMMWDLGFDVYTRSAEEKIKSENKPRYELKDAGEYYATSVRSFKRLKKESIKMIRWKLDVG